MQLRRRLRRVGAIVGTIAIGGLLGFLVPTVVAEYSPAPQQQQQPQARQMAASMVELPIARDFINAFVSNDQARLKALGAAELDTVKANDLAGQVVEVGKPVLLGTVGGPGISIQAYAAPATMTDGTKTILSWRVVTNSGRAGLILPPRRAGPDAMTLDPNAEQPPMTPEPAAPDAPASPAAPAPDPAAHARRLADDRDGGRDAGLVRGTRRRPPRRAAEPSRPSLFQDRPLTQLEQKRLDVARVQPKPWEPSDDLLDPTSDTGWESAASHELIAIRPEDVVTPESQPFVAPSAAGARRRRGRSGRGRRPGGRRARTGKLGPHLGQRGCRRRDDDGRHIHHPVRRRRGRRIGPVRARHRRADRCRTRTAAAGGRPRPERAPLAPGDPGHPNQAGRRRPAAHPRRPVPDRRRDGAGASSPAARPRRWCRSRTRPQVVAANEGTTETVPPQVRSLIDALRSDNQTAVQLVVPAQPYRYLAGELASDGISQIIGARALYTYAIGNDSATEILVTGVDQSGNALTFNLVVHLKDGAITEFR